MRDALSGLVALALGAVVWALSGGFPALPEGYPGPALVPRLIAVGLVLSGLGLVVRGVRARRRDAVPGAEAARPSAPGVGRLAAGLGLAAAYPLAHGFVGTPAALALLMFGVAWMLRVRLLPAALTAAGAAAVLYLVFRELLGVPL